MSESLAGVGALNDPGDVGDDEAAVAPVLDDAEVGDDRREGVGPDLGLGGRDDAEQGRLAGVREADEPHVGDHLKLKDDPRLATGLARLGVARGLVGARLEVYVAAAAAAPGQQHALLAVGGDLDQGLARLRVARHRAQGHLEYVIGAIGPGALVFRPAHAVASGHVLRVAEVKQGPAVGVAAQHDVPAAPAVAPVGPALRSALGAVEVRRPRPALTRAEVNLDVVDEVLVHGLEEVRPTAPVRPPPGRPATSGARLAARGRPAPRRSRARAWPCPGRRSGQTRAPSARGRRGSARESSPPRRRRRGRWFCP